MLSGEWMWDILYIIIYYYIYYIILYIILCIIIYIIYYIHVTYYYTHTQHNAGLLLAVHAHRHAKLRPDVASAVSCSQLHVAGDSRGGDGGGAAESDDDYEGQVVFSDVPMEVVQVILQHLDPISLAAAACVCR